MVFYCTDHFLIVYCYRIQIIYACKNHQEAFTGNYLDALDQLPDADHHDMERYADLLGKRCLRG